MIRTLLHYRGVHVAVLIGAAVATAVLAGALIVGDSVRGSLRELTLDRLGSISHALVADRFVREALAAEIAAAPGFDGAFGEAIPLVLARGAAVHGDSGARASRVAVHGIDERFAALHDGEVTSGFERLEGQIFPSAIINRSLARELGAAPGDAIVVSLGQSSEVPRDTLLGETDPDTLVTRLRLSVSAVIEDRGAGRFGLTPSQQVPPIVYVELNRLQRALEQPGRVNAILLGGASEFPDDSATETARLALEHALTLDDLGLDVRPAGEAIVVDSGEFVLRPAVDEQLDQVAAANGLRLQRTQSYLANRIESGDRMTPYSLVAALDPHADAAWAALQLVDGVPAPRPDDSSVLINSWLADDLRATLGDPLRVTYFEVGADEALTEVTVTLEVAGVVAIDGLAADTELTPAYPGIDEADDIADWDPPFPVDLTLIRPSDERYWDDHGATPKAFVNEELGRRLWSTRYGSTTAARFGPLPDDPAAVGAAVDGVGRALLERLSADSFGLSPRAVRAEGLRAAAGATDFAGLFVAFSMFLIAAAGMLVGLLFRLGVEQRCREVGLLLAVGHTVARVRRGLLAQGLLLSAIGGLLGVVLGVGYAAGLMRALRTIWQPAVGSSELFLHVQPPALLIGWVGAQLVTALAIWLAVRRLVRVAPPRLLAGSVPVERGRTAGRTARWLGVGALLGGLLLVGYGLLAGGGEASPLTTFSAGPLLLIGALSVFSAWCRGGGGARAGRPTLSGMAARNSRWNPGRSVLSVALVASATFVIVMVASNHEGPGAMEAAKESGAGGYELVAESDVALHQSLDDGEARFELGIDGEDELFGGVDVVAMRLVPGDDASCLNLYRPEKPRLVGASAEFLERGGFVFASSAAADGVDPWSLLAGPLEDGVVPAVTDMNSAMWILKLGIGDELELPDESGGTMRIRLVGMLSKSIFQSELVVPEASIARHFPSHAGDGFFLIDVDPERAETLAVTLEEALAPFGFDATSTVERLAAFKVVENTYLSTFQVLGGLGLLLGTIGLGVVLLRNVLERRGELATLRAFGFRRNRLSLMVLAENAFLLLAGIGIGAGAALLAAAPRLAAISVPWGGLALTLLVVIAVGLTASAAAVAGVARTPLLPALKQDR